ncbi:MAG TPA: hypothetical protein VN577_20215 [Terriglobales bacterium]|nr:hypothetical protein [Terriglobales bacterium]
MSTNDADFQARLERVDELTKAFSKYSSSALASALAVVCVTTEERSEYVHTALTKFEELDKSLLRNGSKAKAPRTVRIPARSMAKRDAKPL